MSSKPKTKTHKTAKIYKPTEHLFPNAIDQYNPMSIYAALKDGFALKDVQAMISISQLYTSSLILEKIIGGSQRECRRAVQRNAKLSAQKSAVVFQYARGLELAISVFGSRHQADQWLGRPCKYLDDIIPAEALENYFGYLAVEAYLENIRYGVYQ